MMKTSSRKKRVLVYALWLFVAAPAVCQADAGVPMIFLTLPAMILALVPIILVEAFMASRCLKLPFRGLLKGVGVANVVSTVIGTPITWILLVVLQAATYGGGVSNLATPRGRFLAVTLEAPWLSTADTPGADWVLPTATLFLLVPFFFVSWGVEYLVMRYFLRGAEKGPLWKTVGKMNFVSYCGLALCVVLGWVFS